MLDRIKETVCIADTEGKKMDDAVTKPKVSIVLPVFNGEKYLRDAVESVLSQTLDSWELIIVNDCSTDNTRSIAEGYVAVDKRIKLINNDKNLKLPRSLNAGFKTASGDYFTWTSDDNILMPDMLEKLSIELDHHKEIGLVYSDMKMIDENGEAILDSCFGNQKKPNVFSGYGASFMYRSDVAKDVGEYDPDMFLAEDYDYWLRMYSKTKIGYISEALYIYRQHSGNLTATKAEQIPRQSLKTLWRNYWFVIKASDSFKERRQLYHYVYRFCDNEEKKEYYRTIWEMFLWMIKNVFVELFRK